MSFGNDDSHMNGSIFDGNKGNYSNVPIAPENIPMPAANQVNNNFVGTLVDKFMNSSKDKQNVEQAFIKDQSLQLKKIIEDNKEIFEIFAKYDCKMSIVENGIVVEYPSLNMTGKMTIKEDGTGEFDEDAMKIFEHLAKLIVRSEKMNSDIDKYEAEGFYPVGDLISEKITYKGQEIDVMVGMLANPKGETKKVYFYRGKEIHPEN